MSIATRVPGMKSGDARRNVLVALLYLLFLPVVLTVVLLLSPLIALFLVGTNRNGIREKLADSPLGRLPGLDSTGWKAGGAAFVYVFVALLVVGAALPSADTAPRRDAAALDTTTVAESVGGASTAGTSSESGTAGATAGETGTPTGGEASTQATSKTDSSGSNDGQHSGDSTNGGNNEQASSTQQNSYQQQDSETKQDSSDRQASGSWTKKTVTITEIVDGDTVKFRYRNGTSDTGRLLGVDTPEVHTSNDPAEFEGVPTNDAGASCLRDWGHKASEFARAELAGEKVTITLDANEGPRGYYGRLLVYIRDDGKLFNYQLVSQGYARVYDSEFTKRDRFYSAESTAQRNGVGLWECRNARGTTQPPSGGGGSGGDDGNGDGGESDGGSSQLTVTRIHEDANGNDHDNLNGEYVVFENTGDSELDLSGWTISDAADHTYRVPSGVSLAPGETVTLYTGGGSDSASELYWGSGSAVWNNGGDTIIVTNADGTVVLRKEYSG